NTSVITGNKRDWSEMWHFFDKVVWKKKQKFAKCKVSRCPHEEFSCGDGGSTSTRWCHLENAY
ncbi:1333_t:CDS:1, partial [Racocetra persica]